MTEARVTIVVVPREQFSKAQASLESIYAATPEPFELVYVDGNSPPPVRRYLEQQAGARGFRLLQTERYLTSNEARNLGVRQRTSIARAAVNHDFLVLSQLLFTALGHGKGVIVDGGRVQGLVQGEKVLQDANSQSIGE